MDLNHRHIDSKSTVLPTELNGNKSGQCGKTRTCDLLFPKQTD